MAKKSLKKLIQIKRNKKKQLEKSSFSTFYQSKKRGDPLSNTVDRTDESGTTIRRKGFTRYSVYQQSAVYKYGKRMKRKMELYQTTVPDILRIPIAHRYVNIHYVDFLYSENRKNEILTYVYLMYSDFNKLWVDYKYGFRDKIFTQILKKTNALNNEEILFILKDNYLDILHDVMADIMSAKHEKVKVSDYKSGMYYKMMFGKIPSLFNYYIRPYISYSENITEYNEDEEYGYEDFMHNILQIDIIDNFTKIKKNE